MWLHVGNRAFNMDLVKMVSFTDGVVHLYFEMDNGVELITDEGEIEDFKQWWENRAHVYTCSSANYGEEKGGM